MTNIHSPRMIYVFHDMRMFARSWHGGCCCGCGCRRRASPWAYSAAFCAHTCGQSDEILNHGDNLHIRIIALSLTASLMFLVTYILSELHCDVVNVVTL